ncbi:MAG: hypothetical protein IT355_16395 [Gemmatimonadaceae bacterium]|nr:hypothetical protein [Gemmatimonadaceae bacterium]
MQTGTEATRVGQLSLSLLGGVRLDRDGAPVTGKSVQRRRLAILVVLVRAPQRQLERERILGLLWPDHPPAAARRLLNEAVYVLRRELGAGIIATVGDAIRLDGAVKCDADEFVTAVAEKRLDDALALYEGEFLGAWYLRDAVDFERWVDGERSGLSQVFSQTLAVAADAAEARGDWVRSSHYRLRQVRMDKSSSGAVERAAYALAKAGEGAAALDVIDRHRALLQAEYEADLPPSLSALASDIRAARLAPARAVAPADAAEGGAAPTRARHEPAGTEPASVVPAELASVPEQAAPSATSSHAPIVPRRGWMRRALPAGAFVGVVAIGTLVPSQWRPAVSESRGASDAFRIVIEPFSVDGDTAGIAYVAEGISHQLTATLKRVGGVQVAGTDVSPGVLRRAERGGTAALDLQITGAVSGGPDGVRVSVRVLDRAGAQVGSAQVSARRGDPVTLTDDLSAQLDVSLRDQLGERRSLAALRRSQRDAGESEHAMDLVWRAQGLVRAAAAARATPLSDGADRLLGRADSMLSVAEFDAPNWVVPTLERAWLARLAGSLRSGEARVRALDVGLGHADRAIARYTSTSADGRAAGWRAGQAEAYWVRGQLRTDAATAVQTYRREEDLLRGAEADLLTATSIDSLLAGAWASLGMLRWVRGDIPGAILATQRALALDGYLENADRIIDFAVRALIALADRRAALTWCQRGRRMFPADWRYVECELSVMYIDAGGGGAPPDPVRAWALVDTLTRMDPDSVAAASGRPYSPIYRRMVAAIVSAAAGDVPRARQEYALAEVRVRQSAELTNDLRFDAAHLAFVLRDSAAAEVRLAEYVRARPDLAALVRNDRTTAQFRRLAGRPTRP